MITVKVIMPKMPVIDAKKYAHAVDWGLDTAAREVKREFGETTSTWKSRPTFVIQKGAGERTIFTTDLIYKFVSEGTKPHPIVAKNAKSLHFFAVGFAPKTRVRRIRASAGAVATQGEAFPVAVFKHPGTQAREFAEVIAEGWKDELPKLLQRAIDAVVS